MEEDTRPSFSSLCKIGYDETVTTNREIVANHLVYTLLYMFLVAEIEIMKNIKVKITTKIMGMVIVPILFICIVAGLVTSNITRTIITDEIEIQLRTGAYGISQTLKHNELKTEMNEEIKSLCNYTNIDVTVFKGNERIASTIDGAVGTKMDSHIYEDLQSGEDYFATDANVNGQPYFGYYIPFFTENGEFSGATFTGIPQTEANQTITTYTVKIIGCLLGYGLIFVVISLILVRKMVKGIKGLENTIGTLLDNDLVTRHKKYDFEHDEIEEICNRTVDFSEHLSQIITTIKSASNKLKEIASDLNVNAQFTNDTCNQISQAIESVASGAVSQAEDTNGAAQNISNMSEELDKIKINTNNLHNIANSMDNAKNNALNTLVELQKVNTVMVDEVNSTSNQVNSTSESVNQIKKAVEMIQDIANQTRLLSLNASIEAAHAGEHGRGFAVVAEEIGKLASQSAESSSEIEVILKQLIKNYDVIIQNVKSTSENMDTQNSKLVETQNVFTILEKDINGTVERISEINTMVEHLDYEIGKMVDMVNNLSAISEENSASTEETMASIEELTATISQVYEKAQNVDKSADELLREVNVFKTT